MGSISHQLRYGLVTLVLSSVLLTGSILTYLGFREQIEQTRQLQQERSQAAATKISASLDTLQRQLNYLSELQGLTDFDAETQRRILEGLVNSNSSYEIVGLMNRRGEIIQAMSPYEPVSPSRLEIAKDAAHSPFLIQTVQKSQNYISPVEIDPKTNLPVVTLSVPIRNKINQISGVLFAKINLNFLTQIVSKTAVGKTGYSYVVDNRLVLIAAKNNNPNTVTLQNLKDRPFIQNLLKLSFSPETQAALTYQGLQNQEVIGTATRVRRVQWVVVVELPTSEVYAPLRVMLFVMGSATLIATLITVGLSIAFSRSITIPLKSLAGAASQISQGQFNSRVQIISVNELGELAKSFNLMTEKLQASFSQLREREQQLTQFLEAMPVGVFIVNAEGEPYYINSRAQQLLGKGVIHHTKLEEIREVYQIYLADSEELYPEKADPILCALRGNCVNIDDIEIRRSSQVIPIEMWGTPIYDEQGNIAYAIAAFQDIRQRKQTEKLLAEYHRTLETQVTERTQELSQAMEHLKTTQQELVQSEKMAALGQLVAGIAHEINTPLGAIGASISNITTALDQSLKQLPQLFQRLSTEQQADFLDLLSASQQTGEPLSFREERKLKRALTQEFEAQEIEDAETIASTFVKMGIIEDTDRFLPLLRSRDRDLILDAVYHLSVQYTNSQNIKLAVERASKIVFALKNYARRDHSGQMIAAQIAEGIDLVLTIYHNQLKQGIDVKKNYEEVPAILCYPEELNQVWTNLIHNAIQAMNNKGTLTLGIKPQAGKLQVNITDTGTGIPPNIMPRIFEPFFTTKPAGEGSGLGLDIVKKIIDKHRGTIEVTSVPGNTTFSISLPIT